MAGNLLDFDCYSEFCKLAVSNGIEAARIPEDCSWSGSLSLEIVKVIRSIDCPR